MSCKWHYSVRAGHPLKLVVFPFAPIDAAMEIYLLPCSVVKYGQATATFSWEVKA